MKFPPAVILCLLVLWDLVGFVIFLRGFLVLKLAVPGHGSLEKQLAEPGNGSQHSQGKDSFITQIHSDIRHRPPYDRLVLVLIDALRSDFILPDAESDLPKMRHIATMASQGQALSFIAKSHPPTVTLPRIKALTSGGIPGFIDVILNFDSKTLAEDNLIYQMKSTGRKIVFYGDDTWMQLFPDHFVRSDGTTSFFVTDYTEVDNNVTRHLDQELAAEDWDTLILHYLGLDHIGHTAGPRSPLVPGKLTEMDGIVQKIFTTLKQQDSQMKRSSLVVVCGDHGMSDKGGHGGSSHYETSTALVWLSQQFINDGIPFDGTTVEQVDLVPTISLLLGMPIPQNNLGVVIRSVLEKTWSSVKERLQALHINSVQLSAVFAFSFRDYKNEPSYLELSRAIQSHENWLTDHLYNKALDVDQLGQKILNRYYAALYKMRARLMASRISYDTHAMRFGIASIWLVLLALIYSSSVNGNHLDLSFAPTGWLTFGSLLGLLFSTHFLECLGPEGSPILCSTNLVSMVTLVVSVVAASFWMTVLVGRLFFFWAPKTSALHLPGTLLGKWLATCVFCHSLTLLASSFVEEEHQTCYFITSTSLFVVLMEYMIKGEKDIHSDADMEHLHEHLYRKHGLSADQSVIDDSSKPSREHLERHLKSIRPVVLYTTFAACLTRILRSWNRTGDKWAHLPDIGDWLVLPDSKFYLSTCCAGALVLASVLVAKKKNHHLIIKTLFVGGAFMVYLFRAATGVLLIPFTAMELSKGILEARAVYLIIFLIFVCIIWQSYYRSKKTKSEDSEREHFGVAKSLLNESAHFCDALKCVWVLLNLLLVRPHNIPLVAMVFILEEVLSRLVVVAGVGHPDIVFLYYWFGQATFFWQGNSNSISTVDVSAGYIGLSEYQPFFIGLLMCLSTYAGPVFWMIALFQRLMSPVNKTTRKHLVIACSKLWMTRALPLAIYTVQVMIQRYHLFIWTVFSPKLLYEGMHTVVMATAIFLFLGLQAVFS